eukprot:scaffold4140_cov98-Isochrysis_galbana.AAC.2
MFSRKCGRTRLRLDETSQDGSMDCKALASGSREGSGQRRSTKPARTKRSPRTTGAAACSLRPTKPRA